MQDSLFAARELVLVQKQKAVRFHCKSSFMNITHRLSRLRRGATSSTSCCSSLWHRYEGSARTEPLDSRAPSCNIYEHHSRARSNALPRRSPLKSNITQVQMLSWAARLPLLLVTMEYATVNNIFAKSSHDPPRFLHITLNPGTF